VSQELQTQVNRLVEHLFRHQAGQMLAILTRFFGLKNLDLAEDVVQEALLQAMRQWPFGGVPDNPRAWLIQVARNKALDVLRRNASLRRIQEEMLQRLEELQSMPAAHDPFGIDEIPDEQLAMIFACCHPDLSQEVRVALTLKAVSGFSVTEIGRAFLSEPATIAQRLVRAKRRIRESNIKLAMPTADEMSDRLGSVLQVLYLLYNEGYTAHSGEDLVRHDLCAEAIRLARLLTSRTATVTPPVHALLAIFYLQSARLPTRVDGDGNLLLLADQDRSQWDQDMLHLGLRHLDRCADGDQLTEYHLQAGIAAIHASSASYADTEWPALLGLYDRLMCHAPSPVVALNRAIAQSMVEGPEAGLRALEMLSAESSMKN
jgi:RNA polymerase sigma-70 factor (ECF subfamily)